MRLWLSCVLVAVAGCSSSSSGGDDPAPSAGAGGDTRTGQIAADDLWKDGVVLTGSVIIGKDAVVEIAAGAKITCAAGANIIVRGTLKSRASASHAKITCDSWNGLQVDAGGKLDLEGLEIENALTAGITMSVGAAESRFVDGVVSRSLRPVLVSKGTKLTLEKAKISEVEDSAGDAALTLVEGALVAKHIDYDAHASEGISIRNGGELTLEDSTMHADNGHDLVSAYGAKHVEIHYSTFRGAHCGIHIQPADSFVIDHVTSEDNVYGITIYQSGQGPNTVTASNFAGSVDWLDFQGDNGPITFDNVYTSGAAVMLGGPPPTIHKATAPIADAKPRE